MARKRLHLRNPYTGRIVVCSITHKTDLKGNLFIQLWDDWGPYATVTTGCTKKLGEDCCLMNPTELNMGIPNMLYHRGLGCPTIMTADGQSVWRFDLDKLDQFAPAKPKPVPAVNRFAQDMDGAICYALTKTADMADCGTCNFDTLCVKLPRVQEKKLETALRLLDVTAYKLEPGFYHIGKLFGQGMRNTKAQEYMCEYLKDCGYEAYVHYRMD